MKKIITSLLTIMLGLLMSVNVMADVQEGKQSPDYKTDYYMIVESKAGGIDIYSLPDLNSAKLNDSQIPNGTALHIEGETEDKANNRTWGYTEYHGMHGYVPLDDCRPVQSRKEAIDSELYIAGRDNVDYNADYNVRAYAEDGTQKLYQGPGSKYGEVPGVREIQNGETLHITEDADLVDGSHWGVTTIDGTEGWMDLEKTEEWAKEHGTYENPQTSEAVDMTPMPMQEGDAVSAGKSASPTVTEAPEASATPTATTVTPTEAPKATETPAPTETPAATETPPVTSMAAEDDAETDTKNVLNSEKEQEIYREESDTRKAERRVKQEQVENNAAKNKISEDVTDSAVASSAESGTSYVIKPGDTLYQISISRYGTMEKVADICRANGLTEEEIIYPGQIIVLP